jgi:hypothetical protein
MKFPQLSPLDLKSDITPKIDFEYKQEVRKVAYQEGFLLWQHYKKSRLYSLSQVLEKINKFQAGADANILNMSQYEKKVTLGRSVLV